MQHSTPPIDDCSTKPASQAELKTPPIPPVAVGLHESSAGDGPEMWDGVERRRRDHPPSPTWDGVERRRASAAEARELRERIVGRLEHRRLVRGVATHGGVFVLAVLAAFGACWLVALVLMAGAFSPELTQALKVGAMAASGSVAVIGAIVSWRVGWRSFFVGWLVGGQLYMALALTTA